MVASERCCSPVNGQQPAFWAAGRKGRGRGEAGEQPTLFSSAGGVWPLLNHGESPRPEFQVPSPRELPGKLYGGFHSKSAINWLSLSGPLSWVHFSHLHNKHHTFMISSACRTPFPDSSLLLVRFLLLIRFLLALFLSPDQLPKAMERAER